MESDGFSKNFINLINHTFSAIWSLLKDNRVSLNLKGLYNMDYTR